MSKNALLLHDIDKGPNDAWLPWLKNQLSWRGFDVVSPSMPSTERDDVDRWIEALAPYPFASDTVVVGHGFGASTAIACMTRLRPGTRLGQIVAVACDTNALDLDLSLRDLRARVSRIDLIGSDDDIVCPTGELRRLASLLGVEPLFIGGAGHFDVLGQAPRRQLPEVLDLVVGQP